jgi:hypothetical protein
LNENLKNASIHGSKSMNNRRGERATLAGTPLMRSAASGTLRHHRQIRWIAALRVRHRSLTIARAIARDYHIKKPAGT